MSLADKELHFVPMESGEKRTLFTVYVEDGNSRVEIESLADPDPGIVGVILADAARVHAELYADIHKCSSELALDRIREVLVAELTNATAQIKTWDAVKRTN